MLESKYAHDNIFLTLTYDDDHLPLAPIRSIDPMTGEVIEQEICAPWLEDANGELHRSIGFSQGTLVPDHLTKFMKRLREASKRLLDNDNVRFYACGEYGSRSWRPHYHVILFNCPVPDAQLDLSSSQCGFPQWSSEWLEKLWGFGRIRFSEVTFETCAYCARYMTKKINGPLSARSYWLQGLEKEFSRMSRMPGIGKPYYDAHPDLYERDKVLISTMAGAKEVHPPKYFDRLYDVDYHDDLQRVKDRRRWFAEQTEKLILSGTSLSSWDYKQSLGQNLDDNFKHLDLQF